MTDSAATTLKTCGHCGFSGRDFSKTLRLGCPRCYEQFDDELSTFLPKLHRGVSHFGKIPASHQSLRFQLSRELRDVEALLSCGLEGRDADELLDRWKEIALRLEVLNQNPATSP